MKKVYLILVICLLLAVTVASANAAENPNGTYNIQGVTVLFEPNSQFDSEEQLHIAEFLINGGNEIHPYGLPCIILGHKYNVETVTATKHKVNATAPRCLEETYEVRVCSKCGDTQQTLLRSRYKNCCP